MSNSILVMVKIISGRKAIFIVPNHAPVDMCNVSTVRGQLLENGRIYISTDQPMPGYYADPSKVISVKRMGCLHPDSKECHCVVCRPLERPCGCSACDTYKESIKRTR